MRSLVQWVKVQLTPSSHQLLLRTNHELCGGKLARPESDEVQPQYYSRLDRSLDLLQRLIEAHIGHGLYAARPGPTLKAVSHSFRLPLPLSTTIGQQKTTTIGGIRRQ